MYFRWSGQIAAIAVLCALSAVSRAQGILYPRDAVRIQPFYVKNLRVSTVIKDAAAETTVEQTFVNSSSVEQEGTYLYPLPEGASPTAFSMTVGDRTMEPRILTHDEARQTYENIVRRRRDPALLEYIGRNLVRISVYPIPPQGERVIRMRYTEILKPENGVRKYAYALSTSRFGSKPVGTASARIQIQTSAALKNVYSPSHDIDIKRPDDKTAVASWEGVNDASDRDLTLYFSTSDDDVGLSLLTYRTGERDGYFMLLASPRVVIPKSRVLPKQVVFVLDRTGSMAGEKIQQARKSLLYCLNTLHPDDRFDVITFSESPETLTKTLLPASAANVGKARDFVQNIEASGGTNIDEALQAALKLLQNTEGTQKMVVFLTDGLPTVGETNIETILQHVRSINGEKRTAEDASPRVQVAGRFNRREETAQARIFCFGLGYDVNVPFLDRLANLGHGDADYVKPQEDVEAKVSSFFAKVTSPVLTDVRLAFDGADVYDIYPKTYPDLFKGSQMVITGRYRGGAVGTVHLTGLAGGTQENFKQQADFTENNVRNSYLPRIWATRKIGYLADQLRLTGGAGQGEVIDEIVRLSKEYGIITEYTSFLVNENEQAALGLNAGDTVRGRLKAEDRANVRKEVGRRAAVNGEAGALALDQGNRAKDMRDADKTASRYQSSSGGVVAQGGANGPEARAAAPGNYAYKANNGTLGKGYYGGRGAAPAASNYLDARKAGEAQNAQVVVQAVGDRTFYLQKNNVWQDESYDAAKQKTVNVQAFSDAHFALLRAVPALAAYSSVGEDVIVRIGGNAVHIGKAGKTALTNAEIHALTAK